MIFLVNKSLDTYFNMAAEEYFLDRRGEDVLMFWQNVNTIVVGKNQNTLAEINSDYVKEHDIKVVRRLTGGGAMYQDIGNLNFTFICDNSGEWFNDFSRFTSPVIGALRGMGIPAEVSGRNDITVCGRKISGNAQTVKDGRLLHHGTLLFDSNVEVLAGALKPDKDKIKSKGIASVSSRVANINEFAVEKIDCQKLISAIKEMALTEYPDMREYTMTDEDILAIKRLAERKYSTWEWNYGYSPKYDFNKKLKFDKGIVEVHLQVKNGIIQQAKFFGDYFGIADTVDIENSLIGVKHENSSVAQTLGKFDLNKYFAGITYDELISVMF